MDEKNENIKNPENLENPENSPLAKLKNALDRLYASKELVEEAFLGFESQDLPRENEELRKNAKILSEKLAESEKILSELKRDHEILEKNFTEELRQKQNALYSASETRMQKYLSMRFENETMRLQYLSAQLNQRLEYMLGNLRYLESGEQNALQLEINALAQKINYQAEVARQRANDAWAELLAEKSKAMEGMKNTEIDGSALRAVRKFFQWESFFGLRLISSLGILLIIIGAFTFGAYVYIRMSNEWQCACIFALGLILLAAGEILNIKWRGTFSLALTAGGSGVLFLATALGYLTLRVLPMEAALGVCAGVSVLTFVLAIRHNSQTISIFALVGGYFPIFALNADAVVWAVVYFTILNLFSLALATRKNWDISRFIGLFAGLFCEFAIISLAAWRLYHLDMMYQFMTRAAVISAIAIAYIAYLIIPVFGALFTKTKTKAADIALLSVNVFFRFLLGLHAFYSFGLNGHTALVPAFFALTCICLAVLAEYGSHRSLPEKDRGSLRALFFITSVTFSSLVVLFWFDSVWFSSGWLIEAAGLFAYGVIRERRRFTIAGAIVGTVCVLGFIVINTPNHADPLFLWQYLLVTLGLVFALVILAFKKIPEKHPEVQGFQACAALNAWIFALYFFFKPMSGYLSGLVATLCCLAFGIIYSYTLPKIRAIYCTGIQVASTFVGAVSILWLFVFNGMFSGGILRGGEETAVKILAMVLYIATNLGGVFWMRDLMQFMILKKALPLKFYPLLFSGYFVLATTHNLIVQLELRASSMVLTLIFGFTALFWILFGFAKRNSATRVCGLGLSLFAVVKLFVLDLWGLSTELKIASYFVMGILLLAISFVYQYFSKKLKEEENI